jgi:hypothetical protein
MRHRPRDPGCPTSHLIVRGTGTDDRTSTPVMVVSTEALTFDASTFPPVNESAVGRVRRSPTSSLLQDAQMGSDAQVSAAAAPGDRVVARLS